MNKQEGHSIHVENLKKMYRNWSGEEISSFEPMPESGSVRRYYRIAGKTRRAIGVFNPDKRENRAFVYLSGHLKNKGVHVPEVYDEDRDKNIYLEEDLGDILLFKYVSENIKSKEKIIRMYQAVIEEMPRIQVDAGKDLDYSMCYPRPEFDRQSMLWDLNYFKYYFLKLAGIRFDEQELEDDFGRFTDFLLKADRDYFLYRDFQSRNIILYEGNIFFIDYQGGRKGALQYDIASLLFEAKTGLAPETRNELLDCYIRVYSRKGHINKREFLKYFNGYALIRMLQAFGAFGFRGYFERKHFFLQSIPPAVKNLEWFLQHVRLDVSIPHLRNSLEQLVRSDLIKDFKEPAEGLSVSVNSFSYKKDIPADHTGHGGGFVFDCRALPNPGRYDQYQSFTGKDEPVIQFLKEKPEVKQFIDNVYAIIEHSLKDYGSRSFSHLMINFGCTGGQHRSVYCAEEISRRIQKQFKIKVITRHRELEE
ncbi:MAG: phosphotransferase [Bacteroidales bacterium]|nr:phosphotransferase [Bacteroidales bacterium]